MPVDEGVLLSGAGWALAEAPRGASAALRSSGITALIPDVPGAWRLRDPGGATLSLQVGRYDETPLDCGRPACHASIATADRESPMTEALRGLPAPARPCAMACHTTGASVGHDGGFADLARAASLAVGETPWDWLPPAVQRVAGVTCLGCHGPGAIPEASGRWAVVRADVCATCHDAPPTYGHVAAWRSSRMARSDADPATRASAECRRCHTTSGFLASLARAPDAHIAPPEAAPMGIACAACHAPHDGHGLAPAKALLRSVPLPAWAAPGDDPEGPKVCLICHSPESADATRAPSASAAALWAGRGGVDPATGAPVAMPAVHADLPGSCVACHDGGPPELERGRAHAFRANPSTCTRCHADGPFDAELLDRDVQEEARTLLARLAPDVTAEAPGLAPRHATPRRLGNDAAARAVYDVLLVLEDPAAASHNEPYARALLQAARAATPARLVR